MLLPKGITLRTQTSKLLEPYMYVDDNIGMVYV
jgi:hypothetical protein